LEGNRVIEFLVPSGIRFTTKAEEEHRLAENLLALFKDEEEQLSCR
jgi:hypothetical protein